MKRLFWIMLLVAALASGCAEKPPEPKLTSTTIAFRNWVGYGLFYLAQEKEFFKEEGLEPIFMDEQLDSDRRDAFKQGMLDFEGGTLDLLISKLAQDTPLRMVMEIDMSFGADAIVADEGIKTLEDLAGKRVALARNDVGETFISTLFYKKALPFDAMNIVPKRPEEVAAAFFNGEADACVTWEPQVSQTLKKKGAHILASTRDHPGIVIDSLNVRKDFLEKNREAVKGFMRAWFKALNYYREHPLEASGIIAKYYQITPEKYRKQVEGLTWYDYERQRDPSEIREWSDAFAAIGKISSASGRIPREFDPSESLDHTLLERLYEDRA